MIFTKGKTNAAIAATYIAFFAMIAFAIYVVGNCWPLLAIFAVPKFKVKINQGSNNLEEISDEKPNIGKRMGSITTKLKRGFGFVESEVKGLTVEEVIDLSIAKYKSVTEKDESQNTEA